jgi:predicted DNA-binding transcriptional regulator AlpA
MNRAEFDALPAVLDVPAAAAMLHLSRAAAYELIRVGGWPTPVFRLGRLIRIPTQPVLTLLCVDGEAREPATAVSASVAGR